MAALVERYPFRVRVGRVVKEMRLEVQVTGMGVAKVRMSLGVLFLSLAARIIGCQLEVSLQARDLGPASSPSLAIPPVRLSVADLGRADAPIGWADATRIRVCLDGVEQREVVAYDCEAGTVERLMRDKLGEHMLTPDRQRIAVEIVKGTVTAEFREPA